MAKIFLRQFFAAEFVFSTNLPQKIRIDIGSERFRRGQKLFEGRFKTQYDSVRLDLAAFAGDRFNL